MAPSIIIENVKKCAVLLKHQCLEAKQFVLRLFLKKFIQPIIMKHSQIYNHKVLWESKESLNLSRVLAFFALIFFRWKKVPFYFINLAISVALCHNNLVILMSVVLLRNILQYVIVLSDIILCHYTGYHYAELHFSMCHYAEYHLT